MTDVGTFREVGNMNTEQIMDYHLRCNHYPPVTHPMIVKACVIAVEKVEEGIWRDDETGEIIEDSVDWGEEVTWEEGGRTVNLQNAQTGAVATLGDLYENYHLQDFC